MPEPYLVFISHSARDTWVARQISRRVVECGGAPFLDETDIETGDDFENEIREFLRQAHEVVVLLTPWALERPYVWSELGGAWLRDLPIVGLLLGLTPGDIQSKPGLPLFLKRRNMLELNDADKYFDQLALRIEARR